MTTPSYFSGTGLTISVNAPLAQHEEHIGNYAPEISSYSHTISSNGGFTSASIEVAGNHIFAEDWLQNGLGRHIVVYGPGLQIVWEGFVNEMSVNMGNATYTRGPLVNVANRVSATYTELIEYPDGTVEPVTGVTAETIIAENEDSQELYGIWEKVINIGEVFPADADEIRDLYLEENCWPEGNPTLSVADSRGGGIVISLTCRGYVDWINNYVYNDDGENQYVYTSELIKTILGVDPNTIISTEYDRIDENLNIYPTYTNENKMAKTIIDDILTLGGGNDDRWTFGVYENRKAVYSAIPTEIEYIYYKTERAQEVQLLDGTIVKPWDVRPCKWVAIPDFLSSFSFRGDTYREDPRTFFAEEVSYTAPDQVSISGAKVRKLSQYLAKLGLGGV